MTNKQRQLMVTMKKEGKTLAVIATKFKCSPQTVSYWVNKKPAKFHSDLPTTKSTPRKPKALIPTTFECPHCGGPIS